MRRIVWDQGKCTGCRVCEAVCSFVKEAEFNPVKSRVKVLLSVDRQIRHKVVVFCLQCEEAYCKAVCPVGAVVENAAGARIVDEDRCIGCRLCEMACPVGAISVSAEKGVALKCDLCADKEQPQCVKYCFSEALMYLPDEKVGVALARAKSKKFLDTVRKEA
jgi:anaerobic carbon-monoxide dehydrogenase iron sulfur subunit